MWRIVFVCIGEEITGAFLLPDEDEEFKNHIVNLMVSGAVSVTVDLVASYSEHEWGKLAIEGFRRQLDQG